MLKRDFMDDAEIVTVSLFSSIWDSPTLKQKEQFIKVRHAA